MHVRGGGEMSDPYFPRGSAFLCSVRSRWHWAGIHAGQMAEAQVDRGAGAGEHNESDIERSPGDMQSHNGFAHPAAM